MHKLFFIFPSPSVTTCRYIFFPWHTLLLICIRSHFTDGDFFLHSRKKIVSCFSFIWTECTYIRCFRSVFKPIGIRFDKKRVESFHFNYVVHPVQRMSSLDIHSSYAYDFIIRMKTCFYTRGKIEMKKCNSIRWFPSVFEPIGFRLDENRGETFQYMYDTLYIPLDLWRNGNMFIMVYRYTRWQIGLVYVNA